MVEHKNDSISSHIEEQNIDVEQNERFYFLTIILAVCIIVLAFFIIVCIYHRLKELSKKKNVSPNSLKCNKKIPVHNNYFAHEQNIDDENIYEDIDDISINENNLENEFGIAAVMESDDKMENPFYCVAKDFEFKCSKDNITKIAVYQTKSLDSFQSVKYENYNFPEDMADGFGTPVYVLSNSIENPSKYDNKYQHDPIQNT